MSNELLIRNAILNGKPVDVLIQNGRFSAIEATGTHPEWNANQVIDCQGKRAITGAFYNVHTHAAMTLMRGLADDRGLMDWLQNYIWPLEAKLTEEDVEIGSKLAIVEMIRSGTVFFNDMYWFQRGTLRAVEALGIRAELGLLYIEGADGKVLPRNVTSNAEVEEALKTSPARSRVSLAVAPHAIYTVSAENLRKAGEFARETNRRVHIHLSETVGESDGCRQHHHGLSPLQYLDTLGLVNEKLTAAHCVTFDENDLKLAAERQICLVHMPCSNMKLGSGIFPLSAAWATGCHVAIGTDGTSSNNNLSMIDEMKFAALGGKYKANSVTAVTARKVFDAATRQGALAMGLDAGTIEVGKLADAILWDLDNPAMTGFDLCSDIVYASDSSAVASVICDGKVLMLDHVIPGEAEIIAEAQACIARVRNIANL